MKYLKVAKDWRVWHLLKDSSIIFSWVHMQKLGKWRVYFTCGRKKHFPKNECIFALRKGYILTVCGDGFLLGCGWCLPVQFSSVAQLYQILCDSMDCSTPGFCLHHQLLEPTQIHVHRVRDAIQPSHPLSFPFPPAFNLSQHQGLFKWVSSLHQVAKVLEFQLQHQSFQWVFRTDAYKENALDFKIQLVLCVTQLKRAQKVGDQLV